MLQYLPDEFWTESVELSLSNCKKDSELLNNISNIY